MHLISLTNNKEMFDVECFHSGKVILVHLALGITEQFPNAFDVEYLPLYRSGLVSSSARDRSAPCNAPHGRRLCVRSDTSRAMSPRCQFHPRDPGTVICLIGGTRGSLSVIDNCKHCASLWKMTHGIYGISLSEGNILCIVVVGILTLSTVLVNVYTGFEIGHLCICRWPST